MGTYLRVLSEGYPMNIFSSCVDRNISYSGKNQEVCLQKCQNKNNTAIKCRHIRGGLKYNKLNILTSGEASVVISFTVFSSFMKAIVMGEIVATEMGRKYNLGM